MAYPRIIGSGLNSGVTLEIIHNGMGSFRKDTSTTHSQVELLQTVLTSHGYNTQGCDGKYGNNTKAAVTRFQAENGLDDDGVFGRRSLEKLENVLLGGRHLDDDVGGCEGDGEEELPSEGPETDVWGNGNESPYVVMQATRLNNYTDAAARILQYSQNNPSLQTVTSYFSNLEEYASDPNKTYDVQDCSGLTQDARNGLGYHGSTTNFCQHCKYYGSISDLGGIDKLIPGMELYQAWRHPDTDRLPRFHTTHIGVYAGKVPIRSDRSPEPAVYQSSGSYGSLPVRYTNKEDGANLTGFSDNWTYWGWSKYIRADESSPL